MAPPSVDKKSRSTLQDQGELEDQEVQVVEVPEDVDVVERVERVAIEAETEEVMAVNVGEATVTEEEDMAEKEEEDADMVAVEVVIGREEDMEEVQTATEDHVEVDNVEAVDMEVVDMDVEVLEVLEVVGMKVAEEVDRKEDSTARASRQPLIR